MLTGVFLVLGLILIGLGVWLRVRPRVVTLVAERYNKQTARWLARRGLPFFLKDFDSEVQRMRTFLPMALVVIGVGFCVFAVRSL
jgi:uncharacterized membrane protein YczE